MTEAEKDEEQTQLETEIEEGNGELAGEPFYMELGVHRPTISISRHRPG